MSDIDFSRRIQLAITKSRNYLLYNLSNKTSCFQNVDRISSIVTPNKIRNFNVSSVHTSMSFIGLGLCRMNTAALIEFENTLAKFLNLCLDSFNASVVDLSMVNKQDFSNLTYPCLSTWFAIYSRHLPSSNFDFH